MKYNGYNGTVAVARTVMAQQVGKVVRKDGTDD